MSCCEFFELANRTTSKGRPTFLINLKQQAYQFSLDIFVKFSGKDKNKSKLHDNWVSLYQSDSLVVINKRSLIFCIIMRPFRNIKLEE